MGILSLLMALKIRANAPGPKFLCAFSPPGRTALDHSLIIAELTHRGQITGADERARALWAKLYQTRRIAPGLLD